MRGLGGGGVRGCNMCACVTIKVPTYSHHLYLVRRKAFLFGIILGQLLIILHATPTQLCHVDTAETLLSICPHNVQLSSHRAHKHDLKLVHTCADWSVQFLSTTHTHAHKSTQYYSHIHRGQIQPEKAIDWMCTLNQEYYGAKNTNHFLFASDF